VPYCTCIDCLLNGGMIAHGRESRLGHLDSAVIGFAVGTPLLTPREPDSDAGSYLILRYTRFFRISARLSDFPGFSCARPWSGSGSP
jgi:hypothetical protein